MESATQLFSDKSTPQGIDIIGKNIEYFVKVKEPHS